MITWTKLALIVLFLSACADVPTDAQSGDSVIELEPGPLSVVGPENLEVFWEESQVINIAIAGGSDQSLLEGAASTAANNWNSEVLANFSELPRFDQVSGSGLSKPRVFINYVDTAYSGIGPFGYCGATGKGVGAGQNQERPITIYKKDNEDSCGGRIVDDLTGVIAHEFAEALGVKSPPGTETVWCVANVQATASFLNKVPCAWEQQLVYDGYEVRPVLIKAPWFNLPVVRSLYIQGVSVDTMMPGDTVEFRAVGFAGPEPSQPFPRDSTAIDAVEATWTRSNPLALTIVSQTDSTVLVTAGAQSGQSYLIIEAAAQRKAVFPWPKDSIRIVNPSGVTSDFCIADWTDTWKKTDQYLNAACGQTGPGVTYSWQVDAGAPSAFTADTLLDFAGHAFPGSSRSVTLITKAASGDTAMTTKNFDVTNLQLIMSGPDVITQKKLYTYTTSFSFGADPCWFDRYPPQYTWLDLGACRDTLTWIWPAGEYSAIMRAEKSADRGRARIDVEVCTVTQSCGGGGAEFRLPGAESTLLEEWGLFGLGPWMTAGSRGQEELLRLYDLTGLSESDSPFAQTDWLSQASGQDTQGGWTVTWQTLEDPWADARLIRFETSAPSGQAHRFGMAVDPDIGRNAANDRSGFDAGRQLVLATDPAMVVGFMIVDADGDPTVSVRQFGARRLAPRVREDAWNTHRFAGMRLYEGEDDVQFLIWKDAVQGTAQWTLVILRGSSVADIQAKADVVMERLGAGR